MNSCTILHWKTVLMAEHHMLNNPTLWTGSWMNSLYWPKGNTPSCSERPRSAPPYPVSKPSASENWSKMKRTL